MLVSCSSSFGRGWKTVPCAVALESKAIWIVVFVAERVNATRRIRPTQNRAKPGTSENRYTTLRLSSPPKCLCPLEYVLLETLILTYAASDLPAWWGEARSNCRNFQLLSRDSPLLHSIRLVWGKGLQFYTGQYSRCFHRLR